MSTPLRPASRAEDRDGFLAERFREQWRRRPDWHGLVPSLDLDAMVGVTPVRRTSGANRPFDVARVEAALHGTGDLDLTKTEGPTGYAGLRLDEAIRRFQTRNGLRVDGLIAPDGETLARLGKALERPIMTRRNLLDAATASGGRSWDDRLFSGDAAGGAPGDPSEEALSERSPRDPDPEGGATDGTFPASGAAEGDGLQVAFAPALMAPIAAPAVAEALAGLGLGAALGIGGAQALKALDDGDGEPGRADGTVQPLPPSDGLPGFPPMPGTDPDLSGKGEGPPPLLDNDPESFPDPEEVGSTILITPEEGGESRIVLFENRRGDAHTQKGNKIVRDQMINIWAEEGYDPKALKHVGGSKKGNSGEDRKEIYLSPQGELIEQGQRNASYPDVSLRSKAGGDYYHINTGKTRKDGQPISSEARQLEKLEINKKNPNDRVLFLPKLRPGMNEAEYTHTVRHILRQALRKQ